MSSPSPARRAVSPPSTTCVATSCGHHLTSSHEEGSSDSDYDEQALNNEEDYEEEEESAASGSEVEDLTRGKRRRQRIHFNVEQLQTVYHLPLKTAAEQLGICEAALKRICRRNFIQKWPYRQLSSVRRRITQLEDRRADMVANHGDRLEHFTRREFQEHTSFVTPEQFDIKLQQLKEEEDQIIRLAHQPRLPTQTIGSCTTTSCQQHLQEQRELQRPILNEERIVHSHGVQSTIADLPPLDLGRVDREFPLLLLANVCESVRAYI
ncbi:unnamed protein product [Peronospora farinosa]|uniref:RWP-RK domain-containing protein n=1 Tax=Peronospora farinosa TaxID=134698 RepID=A0AAV0TWH7_9STRA|nr:unnamed protein product [Peronospora farinosa]CAI5727366.1 unnamed protein product [Peronospora farinosa]